MATVVEMPKLSDTMEEGGIANWLKKEGEAIKEGEPLVEIETDKATQEYESPGSGVLLKIIVAPGKTVPLRTPIAVIAKKDEKVDLAALLAAAVGKAPADAATPAATATATPAAKPSIAASVAPHPAAPGSGDQGRGRLRASPLAKRLAKDQGLDLQSIAGSGPGGRIVARDLEVGRTRGVPEPVARVSVQPAAEDRTMPVTMMRKTIAKRLTAAKNEAPHFYLTVSCDCTQLLAWRTRLNDEAAKSQGQLPKISVNDIVILAASRALKLHPMVNASWQGDTIQLNGNAHIAMAVALPEGLVTPVLRHADSLGLRAIAAQTAQLGALAKAGKLGNQDFLGGTFTISNLGMFGIEEFTAIINPPQAAILAVGAAIKVPAIANDGQLTVATRMKMTMSCDHRVVDGATGAQFLKTLTQYLEDPMLMMA